MYLDMGSLTGVGLTSPGISNGHRARDMSCLEGGTFVCLYVCMLFLLYVSTCMCVFDRKSNSIREFLLDMKREGRVFVVGKIPFLYFCFLCLSFSFPLYVTISLFIF